MTPSTHEAYLSHLSSQLIIQADNRLFWQQFSTYGTELATLLEISLDPVRQALADLYCPTNNGAPKDACAMLRSWLLMTYSCEGSPTVWATRLKREASLAILAGFAPGQTPCATTHIDFLKRLANGPYALRTQQDVSLSQSTCKAGIPADWMRPPKSGRRPPMRPAKLNRLWSPTPCWNRPNSRSTRTICTPGSTSSLSS
jgi:hypothetical protein